MDRATLETFPGLRSRDFQHPADIAATRNLRGVPGFERLCTWVMEYGFERAYYIENTAENVRISERQFPKVYACLEWACEVLDLAVPEIYMIDDPEAHAFTYGQTQPFVTLSSGLLEIMDEDELTFLLGIEVGHIKCEHVLYTMVARNIAAIMSTVGQITFGLSTLLGTGLEIALFDWSRKAQLSADRAGLLTVQDRDVALRSFMKLAGGGRGMGKNMNPHAFVEQIRAYEDADRSGLNRSYKMLLTAFRTHPFPILRAKHLDAWVESGGYEGLTGQSLAPAFAEGTSPD